MKQQELRKIFAKAVYEVFEKMYYVFLEAREDQAPHLRDRALSITFSGPASGTIGVFFSEALTGQMIRNSLNLDPEEAAEELRQDCLKECLNMICGDFLQGYNPERLFQMSLPHYHEAPAEAGFDRAGENTVVMCCDADGGYFEGILKMDG
ncbi:MAG TPA: chemotaxis protein CheX [Syntrophales bacterium]|jgi:hypothetical protein|nr:chemotaxis protein CheX [Syntrophales bacterium]HON22211.1 chemotaxis protein CheX [Syntrophales bacterium]HOU77052.1 chemotaxis protein CheX [Syntrophales bacterium]HPC32935.1 chemotaxis protein CheX [Syntrophales bacterium]HQG35094.1 chemotaxis protein CheX [Syntrophales bacterium]